jgi:RHH-type transcriptional regulator, proline utilization regulon repressor / proline dehydrogenase / delta 1-pyrroline-5-carboxylate dehydrogenase
MSMPPDSTRPDATPRAAATREGRRKLRLGRFRHALARLLRGVRTESHGAVPPPDVQGDPALEARIQEIGRVWLGQAREASAGAPALFGNALIERALAEHAFKVQLFRFVDVFPMLRSSAQVHEVLVDYFTAPGVTLPPGFELGLRASGLVKGAASRLIARQIESMARGFIAGSSADEALPRLRERWQHGIAFSIDVLGEACVSEAEARAYQERYLALVDRVADLVEPWEARPALERDHLGAIPRANLSLKVSSLDPRAGALAVERGIERALERLLPILERARARGVFINFDVEQRSLQELCVRLFERCCEASEFPAGIALQAYLRSADADAERLIRWARSSGRQVTVRLVKGAYWDYETIRAEREGWPSPVWAAKWQTDACFERLTARFLEATPRAREQGGVKLALGTHNARSIAAGLAQLERAGLPPGALELQMLYGMAGPLKEVARARDLRVREYVPVGELIPGMAYLVRRLLENTSNESWLRASALDEADDAELLAPPARAVAAPEPLALEAAPERHLLAPAVEGVGDGRPFRSEPLRDFSERAQRERFAATLERAAAPRAPRDATSEEAEAALARAREAFRAWRDTDPLERARCLVAAAARLRERRDEHAALLIHENGKTWSDADAEVCEAIDFLEYYARLAPALFRWQRLGRFVGELDQLAHEPRGVALVISPWNFPLAIACGMASAALVTGNTVLLKPAEQTPGTARALCEALWKAGIPRAALQLLPGEGDTLGASLVRDPRVALIAFTGSRDVGLDIVEAAGRTDPAQGAVKRVVCEMGGKNAIVVDDTADLDEAVVAVRDAAFGYQGQKCSACSRAVVHERVHAEFLARLVEATRCLTIGDPRDPDTDFGPLIDAAAASKVLEYVEIGRIEGRLELALEPPAGLAARVGKPYVGAHIFSGIERPHRLANEEIFGPVLSVICAKNFDDALREANATAYKLTGGIFSRTPSHLERARRELRVGNLYINRGITGARVGRQPFGGFGMSGLGSQAGGPHYLLHFVDPRSVCENTMRRGFAPEL